MCLQEISGQWIRVAGHIRSASICLSDFAKPLPQEPSFLKRNLYSVGMTCMWWVSQAAPKRLGALYAGTLLNRSLYGLQAQL